MLGGVIQGDKRGDGAKADRAQRQGTAVGQHPAQYVHERQAHAGHDRCRLLVPGQQHADDRQQNNADAHAPQPEVTDQQHPQRCADGQRAITGDAVPRDNLGRVGGADAADSPADGARAHQAFRAAEDQSPDEQADQAEGRQAGKPRRQQHEHATQAATDQADQHRALAAQVIDDFSGIRAAEQRGQVLHADHQPGNHGAIAQLAMDIARQNGQGNTNVQVADKGEQHDRNNLQRDRHGALGIWHGRGPLSQQVKIGC